MSSMSTTTHAKATAAHESAAKTARMVADHHDKAAEYHQKGDHKVAQQQADKAMSLSDTSHEATKAAGATSKTLAH